MMRAAALTACALAVISCAKTVAEAPLYPLSSCRHVDLVDAETGSQIIGAEDMAIDRRGRRIFISAYDRRKVEAEAAEGAQALAQGGLYALAVADLKGGEGALRLSPLVRADALPEEGLRPHGVSFDEASGEILFINRGYSRLNGKWRLAPSIMRISAEGMLVREDGAAPCAANDVAASGDETLISFDHAHCGWRGKIEDALGVKKSGVMTSDGAVRFAAARFANGLAVLSGGEVALAATREDSILILRRDGDNFSVEKRFATPGSPDNLTLDGEGRILAALHPSLASIALERKLGVGKSASRAVSIDPSDGALDVLFDDPMASLISAATVALEADGDLVLGSVVDEGLVVCSGSGETQ